MCSAGSDTQCSAASDTHGICLIPLKCTTLRVLMSRISTCAQTQQLCSVYSLATTFGLHSRTPMMVCCRWPERRSMLHTRTRCTTTCQESTHLRFADCTSFVILVLALNFVIKNQYSSTSLPIAHECLAHCSALTSSATTRRLLACTDAIYR